MASEVELEDKELSKPHLLAMRKEQHEESTLLSPKCSPKSLNWTMDEHANDKSTNCIGGASSDVEGWQEPTPAGLEENRKELKEVSLSVFIFYLCSRHPRPSLPVQTSLVYSIPFISLIPFLSIPFSSFLF